jgi:hypothetical protein
MVILLMQDEKLFRRIREIQRLKRYVHTTIQTLLPIFSQIFTDTTTRYFINILSTLLVSTLRARFYSLFSVLLIAKNQHRTIVDTILSSL